SHCDARSRSIWPSSRCCEPLGWNNDGRSDRPVTDSMPKMLSVVNLSKRYGGTVAVDDISFDVARDEIVGLLGPNGAGKTTTINMILGVLEPSSGEISIAGVDLSRHRSRALGCTNFAAVYAQLPGNLTVYQNLRVFGLIYGVTELAARI